MITSIYPNGLPAGGYDPVLYVDGTDFALSSVVNVNGTARPTNYLSSTRLQVYLSASDVALAGSVPLTVSTTAQPDSNAATLTVGPANFIVKHFPVTFAQDLAWDSVRDTLYVVSDSNNISTLDPATGALHGIPIPGGPADHIVLSDDMQYMYLFQRAGGLQRLLLPSLSLDITIPLPAGAFDVSVAPGAPHTVAVSTNGSSLGIYDDATPRATIVPRCCPSVLSPEITWGADATALYGRDTEDQNNTFYAFNVTAAGVTLRSSQLYPVSDKLGSPRGISFDRTHGRVHLGNNSDWSQAIDPVAVQWAGRFDAPGVATIDPSTHKAFLVFDSPPSNTTISSYDLDTNAFLGAISFPEGGNGGVFQVGPRAVRFGSDGLAYINGNNITIVSGPFVSDKPAAIADLAANMLTIGGQRVLIVPQPADDIAWSAATQLLYLAMPGFAPGHGNSIAAMDPQTGRVVAEQPVISDAQVLVASDDGRYLYAGLNGTGAVQRLLLPSLKPDVQMPLGWLTFLGGPFVPLDLTVAPGQSGTVAVAFGTLDPVTPAGHGGISIFDDGFPRPVTASQPNNYATIQWGATASTLYSADGETTAFRLSVLSADANGLTLDNSYDKVFASFFRRIHFSAATGRVYGDEGSVVDPTNGAVVGSLGAAGLVTIDATLNKAWAIPQMPFSGNADLQIRAMNLTTFALIGTLTIPNVQGRPIRLVRWGSNGLAFNTEAGQIYIVSGTFVH